MNDSGYYARKRASFETKCIPEPNSGCWLWTACINHTGYGKSCLRGEQQAHRIAWILYRGEIPDGKQILHRCDTPSCVNPDHLFIGTQRDNVTDAANKGRMRGVVGNTHSARLAPLDVLAIRELEGTQKEIANRFKISPALVGLIKRRKIWRNL